jgi:hypothetical protein
MNTEVEFDSDFFDNASMAWKQNKKYLGNGVYVYLCEGVFKNGRCCLRKACRESLMDVCAPQRLCKLHYQSYQKDLINNKKIQENNEKIENKQIKKNKNNKECEISMEIGSHYELRKKNKKRKYDDVYDYDNK